MIGLYVGALLLPLWTIMASIECAGRPGLVVLVLIALLGSATLWLLGGYVEGKKDNGDSK